MRWQRSWSVIVLVVFLGFSASTGRAAFVSSGEAPGWQRETAPVTLEQLMEVQAVRERLEAAGLSQEEIRKRLAQLPPERAQWIGHQLQLLEAGGHLSTLEYFLIVTIIVLLIILVL